MSHSNLVFLEETPDLHTFLQCQPANSRNFKLKKKLNLLTITFLAIYLLNRGKSSYIYQSSMRVNNTFRKIIDCYGERHCCDSPCQTSPVVFFKSVVALFFFLSALLLTGVRLLQILVKVMFQSFFESLLSHLYHYANENVSVKLLSLILLTSILTNIYSLKNCSVYGRSCCNYSPKSFGFFFVKFKLTKIEMLFISLGRS